MEPNAAAAPGPAVIELPGLAQLIASLQRRGYQVIGPTVSEGAIVYDVIEKLEDLPAGWTDEQEAGRYRLTQGGNGALFGHTVAAQSWKRFLYPAEARLCELAREGASFKALGGPAAPPRRAFLGVRACDLAAIRIQDRILLGDRYEDSIYQERRREALLIAVNCTRACATCFCASMQTGPRVQGGFDLALTELPGGERHVFVVEAGSPQGAELLAEVDHREARAEEVEAAAAAVEGAAAGMMRRLETTDLRRLLFGNLEHAEWERVAERCLACANCTLVCPTCFCTTVEDWSDISGERAERRRRWDSCFTEAFSYIHGGSVRLSVRSRYRQWLTHKLAGWVDQFGVCGCVGCGRCITWCPVGIDITEEVAAIRGNNGYDRG